jgi:hypothetical protein
MDLSPATVPSVLDALAVELRDLAGPLVGLTSLAPGADQLFASAVIAAGGAIVFVRPCDRIEDSFSTETLPEFRRLRALAAETISMPYDECSEAAYEAAGFAIADDCDVLLAVWNGEPAPPGTRGGTSDVVAHRRAAGRPVVVIWPEGAARG